MRAAADERRRDGNRDVEAFERREAILGVVEALSQAQQQLGDALRGSAGLVIADAVDCNNRNTLAGGDVVAGLTRGAEGVRHVVLAEGAAGLPYAPDHSASMGASARSESGSLRRRALLTCDPWS